MPSENDYPGQNIDSHGLRQSSVSDEVTPLLASTDAFAGAGTQEEPALLENGTADTAPSRGEDQDDVPLPKWQILLLCYARLVEPIAFFSIFPFINQMIQETGGLKESDVGFYSGLIESLFSCTQMLLMIPWGWAADRVGRKPVLVFSLGGVSITTALFGFSTTIWQMILFRCLAGVFAGTIVTIRAMLTENTTRKTEARAFSFFAFASNLGIFIGPLIGGALADPVHQYPKAFQHIAFFRTFPYALPTLVTGAIGLSATIVSALFTKETLSRKADPKAQSAPAMSTKELLKSPGVSMGLVIYNYVLLIGFAYTAGTSLYPFSSWLAFDLTSLPPLTLALRTVCPVYWFTDPSLGGLGFTPLQISVWIGFCGIAQAIWLLLVFAPLQHRIGTGGVLRITSLLVAVLYGFLPLLTELLRHNATKPFWVIFVIWCVISSGCAMGYTATQLALNAVTPTPAVLGTLNGIALAISSGVRAVAPAAFTSIFAIGVGKQILAGHLIWLLLGFVGLGNAGIVWFALPEKIDEKPGKATDVIKNRGSGTVGGDEGDAVNGVSE